MQRRTAAIYVVFFVLVAIGAYALTAVAQPPDVSIDGQEFSGSTNVTTAGETYTINISDGSGQVSTVNESVRFTAALADDTTLRLVNGTYKPVQGGSGGGGTVTGGPMTTGGTSGALGTSVPTGDASGSNLTSRLVRVVIPNATNASGGNASAGNASGGNAAGANITTFTLREVLDVQGLLVADPSVADMTLTSANGTEYVRYQNGSSQPLSEYLPPINTRNVSVGEPFPYKENLTTVARINSSAATLAWQGPVIEAQEFEEGANVTIGKTEYVAHFSSANTVVLAQNYTTYQSEIAAVDDFHNRILGLWGIVIISLFAAVLIAALAYLPVRG